MANRYRYDVEISDIQEWPSITVEWLPNIGENFGVYSVILGTHATDNNYLMLAEIWIPHTPSSRAKVHQGVVEDVAWHRMHDFIFGSVGEDKKLYLWDLRTPSATKTIHSVVAHQSMIHGLSFNPFSEWVVAMGSSDKTAKVFDFRMLDTPLHTFTFPNDKVYQVGWSPTKQSILASSYLGSELMVWDLNRINETQTAEEAAQGPPELLFIHRGHTGKISDFSWHPRELGMIASVGEDHLLQIWQMAKNTYNLNGLPGHAMTDCITISD